MNQFIFHLQKFSCMMEFGGGKVNACACVCLCASRASRSGIQFLIIHRACQLPRACACMPNSRMGCWYLDLFVFPKTSDEGRRTDRQTDRQTEETVKGENAFTRTPMSALILSCCIVCAPEELKTAWNLLLEREEEKAESLSVGCSVNSGGDLLNKPSFLFYCVGALARAFISIIPRRKEGIHSFQTPPLSPLDAFD